MIEKLTIPGIKIPDVYMVQTQEDIMIAKDSGLPYIRFNGKKEDLVKIILKPILVKMFPGINWRQVYENVKPHRTNVIQVHGGESPATWGDSVGSDRVADIATSERVFHGTGDGKEATLSLQKYIGDLSSSVNLEMLQSLQLLPAFLGDIVECIKINLTTGMRWNEGYNKKLGVPIGNFDRSNQLPNLIILDVSGSIPDGISATMLSLIDTLRTQVNAHLIITSTKSEFFPNDCKLPSPEKLRDKFGFGNESIMFKGVLRDHVIGKKWGHVFSFGDNDTPSYYDLTFAGTEVMAVHHYHTSFRMDTGYAKWTSMLANKPIIEHDTSWCKIIK